MRLMDILSIMNAARLGAAIEFKYHDDDVWLLVEGEPTWNWEEKEYRLAKTTRKLAQYVITHEGSYYVTAKFYENDEEACKDLRDSSYKIIQRADWTEITVHEEG